MNKRILLLFTLLVSFSTHILAHSFKGRILNNKGEALEGALVSVKGTSTGTFTDNKGFFTLDNIRSNHPTLIVNLVGYFNQEKRIPANQSQNIEIYLSPNTDLNEVEVFGERYKQPEKLDVITRMPLRPSEQIQSISVISDKVISEQGALTITDAVRNVPGVTLFGSYGGVKESMSSRGFRGIPVLKNGVRMDSQFQTASGIIDMQGVESIQMIKGSAAITQGVITDLGNAGGVINVVTKTPKFINAGQVDLRLGSWGQVRPTFDVQTVLDKNKTVAFRLNGAYERADNYRPIISLNKAYINPSLEWRPNEKTTINVELDYLNADVTPVTSTVNLGPISEEKLYDMPHSKFLGFKGENDNTKTLTYSTIINYQLTDLLNIRAAYFNSSYNVDNLSSSLSDLKVPKDYTEKVRKLSRSTREDKNTTFQLDFIGRDIYSGSVKHTFQVGFDYRMADATTQTLGSATIDTINVLSSTINHTLPAYTFKASDPVQSKYSTYGIMAQEVMTINKYVKAILALRYSSINTTNSTTGLSDIRDAWDPMAGVMISPLHNVNLFASYTTSTSLRSAGNILTDSITEVGPSKTNQIEVGIKSDWLDNRLRFNFTYFHIITKNLANKAYIEGTTAATGYYYKAGNLKRDGVEVELNGRISSNLQVMLGYAYLHARYDNSPSYVNGSAPMNAPKHTANGWVNYTVDRGPVKGLAAGIGVYYVGKRPVNEFGTEYDGHGAYNPGVKPFDMPAYTTVNMQLAYNIGKWTTRVFLNNIFDELGYNSYYRGGYINQIDPRNFAVQASFRF